MTAALLPVFLALLLLGSLALYTEMRRRQIGQRNRPCGRLVDVGGARMHVVECGGDGRKNAPVVLFLHGASGNHSDLRIAFEPHMPEALLRVYVDRPGLGHSERKLHLDASPRDQARRIAALMQQLGHERYIVVGHSFGAAVAAGLALEAGPSVLGLVFLAPATHPWNGAVSWYYRLAAVPVLGWLFCRTLALPAAERIAPLSMRSVFSPDPVPLDYARQIDLELLFRPESFRSNSCDLAALNRHLASQSGEYPGIIQPALIVTGDQDSVVWPSIHSRGLERDLRQSRLVVLPGAGHMPHHVHGAEIAGMITELAGLCAHEMSA